MQASASLGQQLIDLAPLIELLLLGAGLVGLGRRIARRL